MTAAHRPSRAGMILRWPAGIGLQAWDYLWRTTALHRREVTGSVEADSPPPLPDAVDEEGLQSPASGAGPLFHRIYRTRIRDAKLAPEELMRRLTSDLNAAAPTSIARFEKTHGARGALAVGDEFVVRIPGPWNGPVRVVALGSTFFRLATLDGHLEAGQIEFRCSNDDLLVFEIEAWARSGDRLSNVLYSHLRMAKETQLHMWISFLEGVVSLSEGRMTGGIHVETRRVESGTAGGDPLLGPSRIQRKLAALRGIDFNFDPSGAETSTSTTGWRVDDFRQDLPSEAPGPPLEAGSFAVAQRLMRGYEFADPSIVRAYYDPAEPLEGRTMLLAIGFHGLRFHVGVRVLEVYERTIEDDGRPVHLWGWGYGTLAGHFEMGRMDWQLWKWTDTGEVQFRIHAYSRRAPGRNPVIQTGFRVFGRRERLAFLRSTMQRMKTLTALGLRGDAGHAEIHEASEELTARSGGDTGAAHQELARIVESDVPPGD